MQKIWKQIGLHQIFWNKLVFFKQENAITTDGDGIRELLLQHERFRNIVLELEKKAHKMQEWKDRAETNVKERQEAKK